MQSLTLSVKFAFTICSDHVIGSSCRASGSGARRRRHERRRDSAVLVRNVGYEANRRAALAARFLGASAPEASPSYYLETSAIVANSNSVRTAAGSPQHVVDNLAPINIVFKQKLKYINENLVTPSLISITDFTLDTFTPLNENPVISNCPYVGTFGIINFDDICQLQIRKTGQNFPVYFNTIDQSTHFCITQLVYDWCQRIGDTYCRCDITYGDHRFFSFRDPLYMCGENGSLSIHPSVEQRLAIGGCVYECDNHYYRRLCDKLVVELACCLTHDEFMCLERATFVMGSSGMNASDAGHFMSIEYNCTLPHDCPMEKLRTLAPDVTVCVIESGNYANQFIDVTPAFVVCCQLLFKSSIYSICRVLLYRRLRVGVT